MLRLLFVLFFSISNISHSQTIVNSDTGKGNIISTSKDTTSRYKDTGYARVEVIGNKAMLRQFQQKIEEQQKKEKRRTYIRIALGIFAVTLLIVFLLKRFRSSSI